MTFHSGILRILLPSKFSREGEKIVGKKISGSRDVFLVCLRAVGNWFLRFCM